METESNSSLRVEQQRTETRLSILPNWPNKANSTTSPALKVMFSVKYILSSLHD